MSRGLGKLQEAIYGLLDGSKRRRCSAGCGALTTAELLDELIEIDLLDASVARKQLMYTVRRSCQTLLDRDLVEGEYVVDAHNPHVRKASWSASKKVGK
jgi:hypothetical protein